MSITNEIVKRQDRIIENQKDIINFQRKIINTQDEKNHNIKKTI